MIKVGMIGINSGNGHPYSFSAIMNGYDKKAFEQSTWQNIARYLGLQPVSNFGVGELKVTHVWTQDEIESKEIAKCCLIPNIVKNFEDLLGKVDAVIIARDDFECHFPLSQIFLNHGTPVFIDKPLTLNQSEFNYFTPFLQKGVLMSVSAMRYAIELDAIKNTSTPLRSVQALGPLSWEKYGIHLIDAIIPFFKDSYTVSSENSSKPNVKLKSKNLEAKIEVDLDLKSGFKFIFQYQDQQKEILVTDNFSMFKRTLVDFEIMLQSRINPIPWKDTNNALRILSYPAFCKDFTQSVELEKIPIMQK